jgi:hypothetical protein
MRPKSFLFKKFLDIEQIYTHIKCGFSNKPVGLSLVFTIFITMIKKALLIPVYLTLGYIIIIACSITSVINLFR